MDSRKGKPLIPVACRYVPFDRYFLTHGDPTWKVKHLKQRILARALSLPIDIARLDPDYVYVPPSTSVNRRKTGNATATNKRSREGFSGDDDEPWNAKKDMKGGEGAASMLTGKRAPSPITFAGAEVDRDSEGEEYLSAEGSLKSGVAKEKEDAAIYDSDSSSASDATRSEVAKPKTRRRGGSVSPIEFANPIVLRRQKSASMGAFLYEKGVEAGMVMPPLPKSDKAKGKQKAKDVESGADAVDGSSSEEEETGDGDGEGDDAEEEVEAGYQVDDDEDSEDWSDDYDDEGLDNYHRSPKDIKEAKDVPPEKPETPPPGGRIVPGGDGSAVPPGSGGQPGVGAAVGAGAGGVHFAPPSTPRQAGKPKKPKKGASIVVGPLTKIAKTVAGASSSHQPSHSMSSAGSQQHQRSQSQMVSYGPPPDPSEQILTLPFALVRFSTGQLLEDDLPLSWYDLRPYELLEVHFTLQPRRFEVSVRLGSILTRFVRGTPFNIGTSELPDREDDDRKKRVKALGGDPLAALAMALERERERERRREGVGGVGVNAGDVPPRPEMFFHTETRELVPLPREDVNAYVKPYWEGWARALRVMAPSRDLYPPAYGQPVYTRAGPGKHAYSSSHVAGYGNAKYAGAEHPGAAMMGGGGGSGMVVWDPAMNTYGEEKEREIEVDMDSVRGARPMSPKAGRNPYHVLSQPVYGPAPSHGHNNRPAKVKHKLEWRERWVVIRDGSIYLYKSRGDGIPTHQLPLSALLALKDAEHLAQNQYIKERRDRAAYGDASTSGKATSPERARTSHAEERRRRHRRSTSTPRPSTTGFTDSSHATVVPGASGVPPLPHGRPVEIDQAERRRRVDESLEALSKWDDLGTSFNFSKKEKGKDKDRGKTRDKDADHSKHKMWHSAGKIVEDAASDRGRRQRSVDLPRDREKIRPDQEWLAKEREREEAETNPRTYIPTSRDDAEAAGMKIICAKFRHRGSGPPAASSKAKHWYTSTGPSLAGEMAGEPDPSEYVRRDDQAAGSSYRPSSSQPVRAPNIQAPPSTVPGRQMGVQTPLAAGASLSSMARSDTMAASSAATTSSGKFGLSGLFGKDKDSDDPVARKEKEDRKREEKERKAKEKEFKRSEKDRKKDDRRRREEEEFRGITSSSSIAPLWIPTTQPSTSQSVSGRDLGDPSATSAMHSIGSYSSTNATSVTLPNDDGPTTPKADQARPQLKISPVSTHHRNGDETFDDDDSDISFSSPVFAHSTESSDDDFSLARDRRGYRYGGYHAPAARKRSAPNVFAPHLVADESKARPGSDSREEKAKEWEGSAKSEGRDSSVHRAPRRSSDNDRERGEWLVLDLGSDSAFTSLLRILHRQNPSIPSAFLPQSIAATLAPASQKVDSVIVQQESTPSSPIATPESGASPSPAKSSDLSGQDDADDSGHPEDLSAFVPHVSNRKAIATPALPYPEWRTALVKNSRFAGMREMDRPVHLAYTAWGREKHAPNGDGNEAQRHPKSDSIWARRTRNSFLRTRPADPKRSPEGQHENSTTPIVPTTLDAELVESEQEDVPGSRKRMSLVSHVSTIKGERPSIQSAEESADTLAFPPVGSADQPAPSLDDAAGMSGSDDESEEGEEVILEVVSDEGFAYGRQDEEGAVAEALGWSSDESDEDESEFEWSAWYTDLPRQHALATQAQEENDRQRSQVVRVAKEVPAPLSPIMFANPFVPDLIEPVMVYDRSRPNQQRPPTPPPKDPEEERLRALRNRRRGEPHATSIYQPIVHSHPNVSTPTLHLHHSSSSTSTLSQSRAPSRAPSSNQLSSQHSMSSYHPLSSPPSRDSLADRHRQATGSQGRSPSLNTNAQPNARMRLESNPASPSSDTFSTTVASTHGHELASQTFPRQHQRQHSRSVSGSDSIFESYSVSRDQETSLAASPPRPSGLHHSASMPSTRIASTSTAAPRTPHTVTFMPQHEEYSSEPFRPEISMEHMPDDRHPAEYRPAAPHASSPPSRHVVPQSPYPSSPSPRLTTDPYTRGSTKASNSVLKKRRSDLAKGKSPEQDMDAVPPLSPTTSEAGSTFSAMQASYPSSRVPASNAFSTAASTSTSTPLDKAKALVRRVRSGSSLGGHEFPTVVEEQLHWESEAARQPQEGPVAGSSGATASALPGEPSTNQPKKKKSAIDRFVRGFESSLDFMDGR